MYARTFRQDDEARVFNNIYVYVFIYIYIKYGFQAFIKVRTVYVPGRQSIDGKKNCAQVD